MILNCFKKVSICKGKITDINRPCCPLWKRGRKETLGKTNKTFLVHIIRHISSEYSKVQGDSFVERLEFTAGFEIVLEDEDKSLDDSLSSSDTRLWCFRPWSTIGGAKTNQN